MVFYIKYHVICKYWLFTSSHSIWKSFISFACPIAMVRTSTTMLNRVVSVGIFVFFLKFRRKPLSFSLLSMLIVDLSLMAFIMLRYVPSLTTLIRHFIINDVEFYQVFFLHLLRWSCNFYPFFCFFFSVVYYITFVNFEQSFVLEWIYLECVVWSFLLIYMLDLVC